MQDRVRIKICFSYDGTGYNGWQRQANAASTVQEIMETKLSMISNARITIVASGRTDAGVHARIQVAHADVPAAVAERPFLLKALNSLLPQRIRVFSIEKVPREFHAIRDAKKKTYLYFIDPNPVQMPTLRNQAWNLYLPLNWDAVEEATPKLLGTHDFKAFCNSGTSVKTTVRTLHEIRWGTIRWQGIGAECDLRVLRVTGSGFLRNMVRALVGTLVWIGNEKAKPDVIDQLFESKDRRRAGPTAPPHGLWLWDVLY